MIPNSTYLIIQVLHPLTFLQVVLLIQPKHMNFSIEIKDLNFPVMLLQFEQL